MDNFYSRIRSIVSKYSTNNIFIIGKGASVDEIADLTCLNGIVLNVNDSERIFKGDICVFHKTWVLDSLKEIGFSCSLYVTDQENIPTKNVFHVPYVQLSPDTGDLISHRFFAKEIYLEDVLLVTAIKIAKIIANYKMVRQHVYLLGFDFDAKKGYSKKIKVDYSADDQTYKETVISAQEHYLLMLLYLLRESNVLIKHVGKKPYSKITYSEFNELFTGKGNTIGRGFIGGGITIENENTSSVIARKSFDNAKSVHEDQVIVVAELTTNHFGNLERLKKMVELAKDAGADYVKVQKRNVVDFYTKEQLESPYSSPFGKTFQDYRMSLELDTHGFELLKEIYDQIGIKWFVSVLDYQSYEFVMPYEPAMIKIPSTVSQHRNFIEKIAASYKGDIVVSTGFTDESYEEYILNLFSRNSKVYLLQCTSAYPTSPADTNIGVIRHYVELKKIYKNVIAGYSSHDIGSICSMMAVSAGAKMIEKHVKIGSVDWAHFDEVAVDMENGKFKQFVDDIRFAASIVGEEQKKIRDCEHHKYWSGSM